MPARGGSPFTPLQSQDIERAIADAEQMSGVHFSVYVGQTDGEARPFAERLHGRLEDPANSVLLLVDPTLRRIEIVTGGVVGRLLDSRQAALAAISMQSSFAAGDLYHGVLNGVQLLANHAAQPQSLHTDTP